MKEEPGDPNELIEGEVILSDDPGGEPGGTRTLRVYDRANGDFLIDIPSDAKVTFGYFNPGIQTGGHRDRGFQSPGSELARATALRIWKAKDQQLAVFLGVAGFRDVSITKTVIRQRVTIETNFEDDGRGNTQNRRDQRLLPAVYNEDDEVGF